MAFSLPPTTTSSRFLDLPAELRLDVIDLIISARQLGAVIRPDSHLSCKAKLEPSGCLSLLMTCRQLYHEAINVLYERSHFRIFCSDSEYRLYGLLNYLGPVQTLCWAQRIRHLSVVIDFDYEYGHPVCFSLGGVAQSSRSAAFESLLQVLPAALLLDEVCFSAHGTWTVVLNEIPSEIVREMRGVLMRLGGVQAKRISSNARGLGVDWNAAVSMLGA